MLVPPWRDLPYAAAQMHSTRTVVASSRGRSTKAPATTASHQRNCVILSFRDRS